MVGPLGGEVFAGAGGILAGRNVDLTGGAGRKSRSRMKIRKMIRRRKSKTGDRNLALPTVSMADGNVCPADWCIALRLCTLREVSGAFWF
jgi:hypothetical protein